MRPPVKSMFRSRQWVQPLVCRRPGCDGLPDMGRRFCPSCTVEYARWAEELGHEARRRVRPHDPGWEGEVAA